MNVICFGNLGYLGTVLNKEFELNSSNYVGFDTGFFRDCILKKISLFRPVVVLFIVLSIMSIFLIEGHGLFHCHTITLMSGQRIWYWIN